MKVKSWVASLAFNSEIYTNAIRLDKISRLNTKEYMWSAVTKSVNCTLYIVKLDRDRDGGSHCETHLRLHLEKRLSFCLFVFKYFFFLRCKVYKSSQNFSVVLTWLEKHCWYPCGLNHDIDMQQVEWTLRDLQISASTLPSETMSGVFSQSTACIYHLCSKHLHIFDSNYLFFFKNEKTEIYRSRSYF